MTRSFPIWAGGAIALLLASNVVFADTLTFEELADGTTLSNQYLDQGVSFSASGFTGAGSSSSGAFWATTTYLNVTRTDLGDTGTGGMASGMMLHALGNSYMGWLQEDGDSSFRVSFANPINSFSAVFAGVGQAQDVRLFVYNGSTLLSVVSGTGSSSQLQLSFSASSITSVVVAPGSYDEWVAVDNISFTPISAVPEASSYAMMGLGLCLLAGLRKRAARAQS